MKRYEAIKNIEYLAIPMFALLFAILPLPYVYYTLLRILITGFSLYCVYLEVNEKYHDEKNKWLLLFGILAIIYNPIVPVHLTKLLWVIINLGSFAVFVSYKGFVEEVISNSTVQSERKEKVREQEYFEKAIEARLDNIEAKRDYIEALAEKEKEKEARLENEISKLLITSGLNRDDVSFFSNFDYAQQAYFRYDLFRGDQVVLGDDPDSLIVQKFEPKLGQKPNAFMKEFAIAKELNFDFTYFYHDRDAFEKAYAQGLGKLSVLAIAQVSVVIGTTPMNICFDESYFSSDPEFKFMGFSMTQVREDEFWAESYQNAYCEAQEYADEENFFWENDGVDVSDFGGYYADIRDFVLGSGSDPDLIIQFHSEKHFEEVKSRGAIEIGTSVVLGEGPVEALVFPYLTDDTKIPSSKHDREQARNWREARNERLSHVSLSL